MEAYPDNDGKFIGMTKLFGGSSSFGDSFLIRSNNEYSYKTG